MSGIDISISTALFLAASILAALMAVVLRPVSATGGHVRHLLSLVFVVESVLAAFQAAAGGFIKLLSVMDLSPEGFHAPGEPVLATLIRALDDGSGFFLLAVAIISMCLVLAWMWTKDLMRLFDWLIRRLQRRPAGAPTA